MCAVAWGAASWPALVADIVEDKHFVGDARFLDDLPSDFRMDRSSYVKDCISGSPGDGQARVAVAVAWWIQQNYDDIEIDIVLPEQMPLRETHDIGEALQFKIEALEEVERAFVHIDWEWEHRPGVDGMRRM